MFGAANLRRPSIEFKTTLDNRLVNLQTAADFVRFSFVVQDSISHLDLKLCQNSGFSDYFRATCDCCQRFRFTSFVNTEERCRQFFTPSRRLLYTLHLDLPEGREHSLRDELPESVKCTRQSNSPHINEIIPTCGFYSSNLSNFIEEAIKNNIPKLRILKFILKMPSISVPFLSRLEITTANEFVDCFYPKITDFALFKDFVMQFNFIEWMQKYSDPKILEHLLFYARVFGREDLDEDELPIDSEISLGIDDRRYLNIGPILKFIDTPKFLDEMYDTFLSKISPTRLHYWSVKRAVRRAKTRINKGRICHMLQIIVLYIDTRRYGNYAATSEALRLIWCSVPDAFITLEELKFVFDSCIPPKKLEDIYKYYSRAVGDIPKDLEPRPLTHLCRTVLRRRLRENKVWIPAGILVSGLPKPLQTFLNLDGPIFV